MKLSKLFHQTFKEAPVEADAISHQLLERSGYIRKIGKGLFIYTPLMWRVLQKLMHIVREELNAAGAQEIFMPQIHPATLWQKTGRFEDFKTAGLLYTLKDREDHEFCLGPTHEEIVTTLVANWLTSYKQLPMNLYQIGNKFRDEIRPRFGLIRAKEFLMKDGYSFCDSPETMDEQYELMRHAYTRIFERLDLDFVVVRADGGKIGKGKSEEFQVRANIGEDVVMVCQDYASNVEATVSIPPYYAYDSVLKPLTELATPKITTIEELIAFTGIPAYQMVKTVIYKLIFSDKEEFVAVGIRGDRQINEVKVANKFGCIELMLASEEEIISLTHCPKGFAGPINLQIPYFADLTCKPMTNFLCGGNVKDLHYIHVNWQRDCKTPEFFDFLRAEEGDGCPFVENGTYHAQKGIEVGHIFNLGTRYSEALGALFQDQDGVTRPIWMGTYGIGIGRVAAACIEQKHDARGIIWPISIAPYQILVTAAVTKNEQQLQIAEQIYQELIQSGFEVLIDDRDERLGFKLKDSDLLGIPYKLIVGKAFEQEGKIEIESRLGEKTLLERNEIVDWAKEKFSCQATDSCKKLPSCC